MRKHTTFATLAAAVTVALLAACSNDDNKPTTSPQKDPLAGQPITITASHGVPAGDEADTRLGYTDNGTSKISPIWHKNAPITYTEAFRLYRSGPGEAFTLAGGGGTTNGTFTGTLPTGFGDYYVFYPAHRGDLTSYNDSRFDMTGQVQKGDGSTANIDASTAHLRDYHYMTQNITGNTPPNSITLEHRVAILRVAVTLPTGTTPRTLKLITPLEDLVISQKVDGTWPTKGKEQTLTLKNLAGNGVPDYNTFTTYMAILPTTIADGGYQIEIAANNGTDDIIYYYTLGTPGEQKEFSAGQVYNIVLSTTSGNTLSLKNEQWESATVQAKRLLGLGTEDRPYLINTAADFKCFFNNLRYCVNTANTGVHYKLVNGIHLDNLTGWAYKEFYGQFDGNNQTITGAITWSSSSESSLVGIFHTVNSGSTVSNLTANYNLTLSGDPENPEELGAQAAGAICGWNLGEIINCHNSKTISGRTSFAGGICGENYGTITQCTNQGNITISATKYTFRYAGGIVGKNCGVIRGCTNNGDITSDNSTESGINHTPYV